MFIGVIRDTSAQKQAEQKLRESEEKLSTLFSAMTEMVVIYELVYDDDGEVVPSLRQLGYNGGMSAIPLFVNLKKAIIELA